MNDLAPRSHIEKLKEESLKLPQVAIPLRNYFAHHLYGREMYVPAGVTITGKVHKTSTIDVLLQGKIAVYSDDGVVRVLEAPLVLESHAGTSKAGHVLEDVRWITFHHVDTDSKDINNLERELVVESYQAYIDHCKGELEWQS